MKHVKNNPPELCEQRTSSAKGYVFLRAIVLCGKPAKYERLFDDTKAKPMRLCGIHARQARRRGYKVVSI